MEPVPVNNTDDGCKPINHATNTFFLRAHVIDKKQAGRGFDSLYVQNVPYGEAALLDLTAILMGAFQGPTPQYLTSAPAQMRLRLASMMRPAEASPSIIPNAALPVLRLSLNAMRMRTLRRSLSRMMSAQRV